jgi:hypothetical protein
MLPLRSHPYSVAELTISDDLCGSVYLSFAWPCDDPNHDTHYVGQTCAHAPPSNRTTDVPVYKCDQWVGLREFGTQDAPAHPL